MGVVGVVDCGWVELGVVVGVVTGAVLDAGVGAGAGARYELGVVVVVCEVIRRLGSGLVVVLREEGTTLLGFVSVI